MRSEIIKQVQSLINDHKLSKREIIPYDGRRIVKVKYTDPVTGKTWSGRGKTPDWVKKLV